MTRFSDHRPIILNLQYNTNKKKEKPSANTNIGTKNKKKNHNIKDYEKYKKELDLEMNSHCINQMIVRLENTYKHKDMIELDSITTEICNMYTVSAKKIGIQRKKSVIKRNPRRNRKKWYTPDCDDLRKKIKPNT